MLNQSDALFREGRFAEADESYTKVLRAESQNLKALIQRGYIALLSNRLDEAGALLSRAIELVPANPIPKALLAEAFYRQDDFERAAKLFGELGRKAMQRKLESFHGQRPYKLEGGKATHLKFVRTDPLPVVKIRVNGSEPVNFLIDIGGAELIVDSQFAEEIGIEEFGYEPVTEELQLGHGRVERLELSDFVVRNVPVHILDIRQFSETVFGGLRVDGVIGTVFLYHFLATLDYPRGELILRPHTEEARPQGAIVVPFWMAGDHFIVAWGTVSKSRPMLFLVDTGLAGKAFMAPESTLKEVGIVPDESKATEGVTIYGKVKEIPFAIDELTLGEARECELEGVMGSFRVENKFGFPIKGLISHQFFRNYALTLDFKGMRLFLVR